MIPGYTRKIPESLLLPLLVFLKEKPGSLKDESLKRIVFAASGEILPDLLYIYNQLNRGAKIFKETIKHKFRLH
jgi:hypothetical protein